MPGLDRTGPEGQGSKTGRGMGRCNPNNEIVNEELPLGRGFRRGQKRGWNNRQNTMEENSNTANQKIGRGLGRQLGRKGR